MASIYPTKKDGKITSHKFRTCIGRDENGKQIIRCTTWKPPAGLTPARERKAAQAAAAEWESNLRTASSQEAGELPVREKPDQKEPGELVKPKPVRFAEYIANTWFPLGIENGERKPSTITFYRSMAAMISDYFKRDYMQDIIHTDIERYFMYLRTKREGRSGTGIAPKSLRSQYATLKLIFADAQKRELIEENPMDISV